ncbi:MAG: hypothetical protein WCK51_04930 [Armatimonadota bacterium]
MIESALIQYGFPGLVTGALLWFFKTGGAIEIDHLRIGPSSKPKQQSNVDENSTESK